MCKDRLRWCNAGGPAAVAELGEVGSSGGNCGWVQKELRNSNPEALGGGGGNDGRDERRTGIRGREQGQDDHQLRRQPPYRVGKLSYVNTKCEYW